MIIAMRRVINIWAHYNNKMYDIAINMIRIARKYLELLSHECGIIVGYS